MSFGVRNFCYFMNWDKHLRSLYILHLAFLLQYEMKKQNKTNMLCYKNKIKIHTGGEKIMLLVLSKSP